MRITSALALAASTAAAGLVLAACGSAAPQSAPAPRVTVTAPAHKHRHAHRHAHRPRPVRTVTAQPAAPAAAPAAPSWTNCNPGTAFFVMANQDTSCPFASNVAAAELTDGTGVLDVTSPTTGGTYAMDCEPDGTGAIMCTGGTGAAVRLYVTTGSGIEPPG